MAFASYTAGEKLTAAKLNERLTSWANIDGNGVPAAARDSFNVASIDDNGIGDYDVNWSTAFANNTYCVTAAVDITDAAQSAFPLLRDLSTTFVHFQVTRRDTGNLDDTDELCVMAVGDQT